MRFFNYGESIKMTRKLLTVFVFALFFSITALALPDKTDNKQHDRAVHVVSLLSQSMEKQKLCAKKGYIGYQNSLSANYLTGMQGNKTNAIKAYAWSLVAYSQIEKTGNKKLILAQQKTLRFVAKKMSMTETQKRKANVLANKIIKHYGKSWPAYSTYSKMKDFPAPCNLK